MPVTASAKKALRNANAKAARNTLVKAELKRALKNATSANINKTVSLVDKAAKRNLIHPNKAARLKSRLARLGAETVIKVAKSTKKTSAKKVAATKAKAIKAKASKR